MVREVRSNGRLLVDVRGRSLVIDQAAVAPAEAPARRRRVAGPSSAPAPPGHGANVTSAPAEIDLHGLIVEDALARTDTALNEALLADHAQLRIIHGRSGGRIRAALHRHLRHLPAVRAFRLDPRNPGVTIVEL